MAYALNQNQRVETGVSVRIDPMVVLRARLLQLNRFELEQAVENELAENPALERLDVEEPIDEREVLKMVAPQELRPSGDWWEGERTLPQEGASTWQDYATAPSSLSDYLVAALLPQLAKNLRPVGEWVIACIDDRGYLDSSVESIALDCGCTLEEAEFVITELQRVAPAGIGARNLQEGLLLQIEADQHKYGKYAKLVIQDYWDEFLQNKSQKLCRKLQLLPRAYEQVVAYISSLAPYPIIHFSQNAPSNPQRISVQAIPDIVFELNESGWSATIQGLTHLDFAIDPLYRKKFDCYSEDRGRSKSSSENEEKQHVVQYVKRANDFIQGIKSRNLLLQQVANALVQLQSGFLATGSYEFITPLTRGQLARMIGAHESTVSRATMGKFVRLPNGDVVSFDVFFKPALRIQKMIEEILVNENPSRPISDLEISQILAERGVNVARRTVHKYRDKCHLLSSRHRRMA